MYRYKPIFLNRTKSIEIISFKKKRQRTQNAFSVIFSIEVRLLNTQTQSTVSWKSLLIH